MPLPVPWLAGCGGISVRAIVDLVGFGLVAVSFGHQRARRLRDVGAGRRDRIGDRGVGCGAPAEASFTWPALTWTVLTLTGFIGSDEPGIAAMCWVWITPLVSGAGSGLACGGTAAVAAAQMERSAGALGRVGCRDWVRCGGGDLNRTIDLDRLGRPDSASASATSALASEALRSVMAATVRLVDAFSRFSASRLRMVASREPPLRPPITTPTRMAVAAAHRGHEIEAGGAGVAGLDAVDAFDVAEQVIVVADRLAVIVERRGREVAIVARETILDGAAKRRLIARGGDLIVIGQAGGVAIDRPASCRARAPCASSAWRNRLRRRRSPRRSRPRRRWRSGSLGP